MVRGGPPDPLKSALRRALQGAPGRSPTWVGSVAEELRARLLHLPPRLSAFRAARALREAGLGDRGLGLSLERDPARPAPTPPSRPRIEVPVSLEACALSLGLKPAIYLLIAAKEEALYREFLQRHPLEIAPVPGHEAGIGGELALLAARDPDTLRELRRMQRRPHAHLRELGALLGYPPCCVEAFAAQPERGDDLYNRYAAAARTEGRGPWRASLNDTEHKLLAHFPCTYRCSASTAQAERLLDQLPELGLPADALRAALRGPVLYFDSAHRVHLEGEVEGEGEARYRALSARWEGGGALPGLLARGDRLHLERDRIAVFYGEQEVGFLRRDDPKMGILMPFEST